MKEVLLAVIGTALTGVLGYLGVRFSKILDKYLNTKEKREVVKTAVRFVEQVYAAYDGKYKKKKAIEYVTETLATAGIPITDLELEGLLESAVKEFNDSGWKKKLESEVSPEVPTEEGADG